MTILLKISSNRCRVFFSWENTALPSFNWACFSSTNLCLCIFEQNIHLLLIQCAKKPHQIRVFVCVCARVVTVSLNNDSLYDFERTALYSFHPSGCFQIDDNTFICFCIFFLKSQSVSLENLCDMNNFLLDIMLIYPALCFFFCFFLIYRFFSHSVLFSFSYFASVLFFFFVLVLFTVSAKIL